MSILDELYEWHMMNAGVTPEKCAAQEQFGKTWNKAEQLLEAQYAEELRNSIFEYMDEECRDDFQAGFRLGVLLMLELQIHTAPISTTPQG